MNIYFSCSITGGRNDQDKYQAIVSALKDEGHTIPTEILADENILQLDEVESAEDVYHRDIAWIDSCDAVVAEVSTPSHGVGYEIAYALGRGKPVICGYHAGRRVSKMLTGNSHPLLRICEYNHVNDYLIEIRNFLNQQGDHSQGK